MEKTLSDRRGGGKSYTKKLHFSSSNEHVLAVGFMTKKALNVEAAGRTFKPFWRAWKDFKTREAGNHVLLFVFKLEIGRASCRERVCLAV